MGHKNKWKIVAILFIILFIFATLTAIGFTIASYISYSAMWENVCRADCASASYTYSILKGDRCICLYPYFKTFPEAIEIGANEKIQDVTETVDNILGKDDPMNPAFGDQIDYNLDFFDEFNKSVY